MKLRKFKKVFAVAATFLLAFSSISTEALFAEEDVTKTLTAVLENMEVDLTYKEGELPEDAVLNVAATEQTKADAMLEKAKTKVEGNVIDSKTFDVSVKDEQGNDLTLTSAASLTFKNIDMQNITKVFALNGEEIEEQDAEIVEKNVDFAIKNLTSSYIFMDAQKVEEAVKINSNEENSKIEDKIIEQNEQIVTKDATSNVLASSNGTQVKGNPISIGFNNTEGKGNRKLQIRVYDKESDELLQRLPGKGSYNFQNENLTINLSVVDGYEIDSMFFDHDEDYDKADIAKNKHKLQNNSSVTIELKDDEDDKNYLDIYVNEKLPEVKGSLELITELKRGSLSDEDYQYELKKSFNYIIVDEDGNQVKKNIVYDLYDLNGHKLNENALITQENGVLRIKNDRKVILDLRRLVPDEKKKYYIQQINGDRYNTTNKVNTGEVYQTKKTEAFVINGIDNKIYFTNERKAVDELISYDKSATLNNWSNRTYDVTLRAGYKSNEVTVKENTDIIFVLDTSGSMIFTDAKVTSTNRDGKLTIDELNKDLVYFSKEHIQGNEDSYGNGIFVVNDKVKQILDKSKETHDGKTKYYGINDSEDNKVVFYENGKWQYFKVENPGTYFDLTDKDLADGLYTERSFILMDSMLKFVDGMSNDCSVGIVTFNNSGTEKQALIKLNTVENRNSVKEAIRSSGGKKDKGTYIHTGLQTIIDKNMLNDSDNEKYIITFTDGEDSGKESAYSVADQLKKEASIYTIGIGGFGKEFLTKLASNPDQYLGSESMSDIYEFLEVISDRIGNAFFRGNIVDYIDTRFDLVDSKGNKLNVNDKVENGDVVGIVGKDGDKYYVKWSNQSVKANEAGENYSWNATIHLKAKEDFLGGNIILTNGKATLDASASHLSANLEFPKPTVNVKELSVKLDNYEVTLNLGDIITPKDYVEKLNSGINKDYLKLSEDEVNGLLKSSEKTLEKNYSYTGTNDVVGKLVYSLDYESDNDSNANWNDHNAERTSKIVNNKRQPIETYKLTVKYVPDTIESRKTKVTFDKEPTHEYVSSEFGATGKYDVMVKNGPDITLDKTANQSSGDARHFTIDLTASSLDKIETIKAKPMDIILLLDNSGSMIGNIRLLNNSVNKFIEIVKEKSPNSRIAIITYNKNSIDYTNGFQDIKTYHYTNLKEPEIGASTNMSSAMKMAYDNYYNSSDTNFKINPEHSQILVSFTDGNNNIPIAPTYPPEFPEVSDIEDYERPDQGALRYSEYFKKNLNVVNYSIALGVPGTKGELTFDAVKFLKRIASRAEYPYYSNPKSADELESVFSNLADVIVTQHSLKNVTITDTITKEFYIPEDEIDRLIKDGASVNKNTDGTTTVTWKNQTVLYNDKEGEYGWHKQIHVVAKEDFLGGNYVPTNTEATMVYDKYTYEFPKPTVNVGTLPINITNDKHVVFKGDTINSSTCLTDLNNSINIASICLTEEELTKLRSNGTFNKVYAYDSDTDFGKNFGKLIYTYTKSIKDDQDHKATKASTKDENGNVKESETYTLKVKYEPMTNEERINYLKETENKDLTNYTNSTNDNQIGKSSQGAHKIYVVAGELDLTKIINEQYTNEKVINSNQSFVFKITKYNEQNELVDTFYQTISFSANDEDTKLKTVKIKDLDKGYYTVEEVSDWSWKYVKTNEDDNYSQNNTSNKKIYIGDIVQDKLFGVESNTMIEDVDYSNPATSKFENKKNTTQNIVKVISDVASAINKFNK